MENNSNGFLPEGYEQPKGSSNYLKLEKGENKFRILSKPIVGWIDWKDNKPMRFRMNEKPAKPVDAKKPIKHFWAFIVWDYKTNQVKILELTQSSIQSAITSLIKDEDWGSPYSYDIKVIRTGDSMETVYQVNPVPHKALANEIVVEYNSKPCNLEALYTGEDPWAATEVVTPLEDMPF